jgi:FkbM family methyltransferase
MGVLRMAFRHWPFTRGRGWLLRASRGVVGKRTVRFPIGGGARIDGRLDDWMILWAFMCLHERDQPFQRSLDLAATAEVVFDVGAHVGVWSLLAARRNPAARIHAFEPAAAAFDQLSGHVSLNRASRVVVNRVAIGAENAERAFFAATANTGASSFYLRSSDQIETRVPVVTLDAYVARERIERVDLIKVDVEGAEALVFKGASRLLASAAAPIVFFELNDALCRACQVTARDVKQLLIDHGYTICRWRRSRFQHVAGFQHVALDERHQDGEDLFALKAHHFAAAGHP